MNIRTRIICLALTLPAARDRVAASGDRVSGEAREPCSALTRSTLPHTADAAEGWFRSCDRDRGRHGPATADGAASWLSR